MSEAELKEREEEPTRIDKTEPYQALIFKETEPAESETTIAKEMLLGEYAATFCKDGERWIQSAEIHEAD